MRKAFKFGSSTFVIATARLLLAALIATLFTTQWEIKGNANTAELPEYSDPEGYVVLSALLSSQQSSKGPVFHINPQTMSGPMGDSFESCKFIPSEFKTAAAGFQLNNRHPWKLLRQFNLPFEYEIADPQKRTPEPPVLPGEQPLEIPQPPIHVVSAVGFNAARDHALLYFAEFAGPEAAGGGYYLFIKNRYGWRLADGSPVCAWMAQEMNKAPARRSS